MEPNPRAVSSSPRAERARQVADVLRQQITSGRFPGGALPGEHDLVRRLGASRNAVREALDLLRREGLVVRRRGVGTTVATPKYGHGLDRLAGLAEALVGHGTVVNEVRVAEAVAELPAAFAERLEVPAESGGVHLERLRLLEGSRCRWTRATSPRTWARACWPATWRAGTCSA
ncbi:GntR family transcriptional regulator [Spirillospora sp. NPDC050679]